MSVSEPEEAIGPDSGTAASRRARIAKAQPTTKEGELPCRYQMGIVSDTHGLLHPALEDAFAGVDQIVHAGDVGKEAVLEGLEAIAPVTAVRGNMDRERWAARLHGTEVVAIGEVTVYVLHDLGQLGLDPAAAGFDAVISGHTHQAALAKKNGVLYVNPGSARHQRAGLPATAALMDVQGKRIEVQFVELVQ